MISLREAQTWRSFARTLLQKFWDTTHPLPVMGLLASQEDLRDLRKARTFYESCGLRIVELGKYNLLRVVRCRFVAFDMDNVPRFLLLLAKLNRAFDCNRHRNPLSPWRWHEVLTATLESQSERERQYARSRATLEQLKSKGLPRAYLFGTGPSLDKAANIDFSDGYRIVCNTIVKNLGLLKRLNPHIIAAGDALYHFSETAHAIKFREDLVRWLELSDTVFVYPAQYDVSLRAVTPKHVHDQFVPIPQGNRDNFLPTLEADFRLPNLGNVLNLLLLPLGTYLAHRVSLIGFDGRDPNASGFWRNSTENSYQEQLEQLNEEYPAFRQLFVPDDDPDRYVREVLGEKLRRRIEELQSAGFTLDLLAPSHLTGLQDLTIACE